eukprot:9479681-Pyramimonas_sp.AAC.2
MTVEYYITTTATARTRALSRLLHYHSTACSMGYNHYCCYASNTSIRLRRYYSATTEGSTRVLLLPQQGATDTVLLQHHCSA